MFAVEIYAAILRFVFVEGKSRREAVRVFRSGAGETVFQDVPVFGAAWLRKGVKAPVSAGHCARSAGRRRGTPMGVPSVGLP